MRVFLCFLWISVKHMQKFRPDVSHTRHAPPLSQSQIARSREPDLVPPACLRRAGANVTILWRSSSCLSPTHATPRRNAVFFLFQFNILSKTPSSFQLHLHTELLSHLVTSVSDGSHIPKKLTPILLLHPRLLLCRRHPLHYVVVPQQQPTR